MASVLSFVFGFTYHHNQRDELQQLAIHAPADWRASQPLQR
jgi:hypothetical protein